MTIATAPDSHARLIREARELRLHVLTEKPFTLDLQDAEAAARPSDEVVAVMHNFQFARSAQKLWADLAAESLGTIQAVQAIQLSNRRRRLPDWYEGLPMGLFFDESPHLLYMLRRIDDLTLQSVDVAQSLDGRHTPSVVTARYSAREHASAPVTLSMNFDASVSEWFVAVHGSRAAGVVDLFRDIYFRIPEDGTHTTSTVLRTSLAGTFGHWYGFVASGFHHVTNQLRYGVDEVVNRFARAIEARADPEYCGRRDALAVRRMQEEILSSSVGDGQRFSALAGEFNPTD